MNKIRFNVKPKCNCEEHYLELCTSFDGEVFVYNRYCYKCGRTWVNAKRISNNNTVVQRTQSCKIQVVAYITIEPSEHYYEDKNKFVTFPREEYSKMVMVPIADKYFLKNPVCDIIVEDWLRNSSDFNKTLDDLLQMVYKKRGVWPEYSISTYIYDDIIGGI